ncbi:MAG TPA: (Fe-S)-binding protein [Alphaproteobacteria bacterium]|nr:(Fe-S)-binding protein [Alphaproteobacteria bacterium]
MRAGLFVTCLVDLLRPSVGFAALRLLEDAGCDVIVPRNQTCCGQPAYNSGRRADAKHLAKATIEAFEDCDYIVAPSGSCAAMLRIHYPALLADEPDWAERATYFAARCHELVSFLVNVRGVTSVRARCEGVAAYHDSCSALRELGIGKEPRRLLGCVEGLTLRETGDEQCCGFGGAFCVKFPEIATRIARDKLAAVKRTGAATILSGDLGCLLHLAGTASREGVEISCRHVAEVLAGNLDAPAIGEDES